MPMAGSSWITTLSAEKPGPLKRLNFTPSGKSTWRPNARDSELRRRAAYWSAFRKGAPKPTTSSNTTSAPNSRKMVRGRILIARLRWARGKLRGRRYRPRCRDHPNPETPSDRDGGAPHRAPRRHFPAPKTQESIRERTRWDGRGGPGNAGRAAEGAGPTAGERRSRALTPDIGRASGR